MLLTLTSCSGNPWQNTKNSQRIAPILSDSTTEKGIAINDTIYDIIKADIQWNRNHKNEVEKIEVDTLQDQDNLLLYLKKDGTLLLNNLYLVSNARHQVYSTCQDHFFTEDLTPQSYKENNFISLTYSVIDEGFQRDYFEDCYTYIVIRSKVYEIRLTANAYLNNIIKQEVSKYDKDCRQRFELQTSYGFCIFNGNVNLRPVPYSALNDDGGKWLKIPLTKDLKFQLVGGHHFNCVKVKNNKSRINRV